MAQSEIDKSKIEDLEFQIEEQKLGCLSNEEKSEPSKLAITCTKDEDKILLKQLEFQKEAVKNQLEEIKFLKEEIERLNVQNKTLLLAEEVHSKDKTNLDQKIKQLEEKLSQSMIDTQEVARIKQELTQKEKEFNEKISLDDIKMKSLSNELADLKVKIESTERERSDIEFENEELKVKIGEMVKKIDQITMEQIAQSKQADVEFDLEEHKVMVQELENKCKNLENERKQVEKKLQEEIESLNFEIKQLLNDKLNVTNEISLLKTLIEQKDKQNLENNSSALAQLDVKIKEKETIILDLTSKFNKEKV